MKVMIVDDHLVVRKGLCYFFKQEASVEITAEAGTGEEAMKILSEGTKPDLILLDLSMPGIGGVEVTSFVKKQYPSVKVLVLTSFEDEDHVISAVQAGADGYCLKDTDPEELLKAIQRVVKGSKNIDPKVAGHLFQHVHHEKSDEVIAVQSLTRREREVLIEIARGKNNREIAATLFITEKTVKTHITNLFAKLAVEDRTKAALLAIRHKLL
ncbi:response regulator transcription factor [Bacillus sp. H-16]|nr:response regulator transcription factor [Alteribacter salitolerans]